MISAVLDIVRLIPTNPMLNNLILFENKHIFISHYISHSLVLRH